MPDVSRTDKLARDAHSVWHATLAKVGGVFHQLVYLSALRDAQTARYVHHGFAERFGEEIAEQAILDSHRVVFSNWLRLSLAEQEAQLRGYLASLPENPANVTEAWLSVKFYRSWMPVHTPPHEQEHYLLNIETLLSLLRNGYYQAAAHQVP